MLGRRHRGRGHGGAPRRISRFAEPALLLLLHRKPYHGYGLMEDLLSLGLEEYPMDSSAVYRTLRNLEDEGMVASQWDVEVSAGPPRRVYTITPAGEDHLTRWIEDLRATQRMLQRFIEAYDTGPGQEDKRGPADF